MALKPSDIAKGLWTGISYVGHGLGIKEFADLLKNVQPSDEAKAAGWKGLFGFADESIIEDILRRNGYGTEISGYLESAIPLPKKPDTIDRWARWYYLNRWRTAVLGLPKSKSTKRVEKDTTTIEEGKKKTVKVEEREVIDPSYNGPEEWLGALGKEIRDTGTDKKIRLATYKAIKARHVKLGTIPYPPDDPKQARKYFLEVVGRADGAIKKQTRSLNRNLKEMRERHDRNPLRRLHRFVFG